MDKLHNGSAGYGSLTNIPRMSKVWLITHYEGIGNDESPVREVRSYFDEDGTLLNRFDPVKH